MKDRQLEGVDRRGRRILCRARVTGLIDENGANHGLVLVFQDITEERTNEDFTRHLGRVLGAALNQIYFVDPKTLRFLLVNDGAQKKLGLTTQQLMQIALPDILPRISADDLHALFAPLISGEQAEIVFETAFRAADGSEFPAQACVQYFPDEAPPILTLIVQQTGNRAEIGAGIDRR